MPINLTQHEPGSFSVHFDCGENAVDPFVHKLGHVPSGYFWESVAKYLVTTEAPHLEGRFEYDPEAGMFAAFSIDKPALEELGERLGKLLDDPGALSALVQSAEADDFEFED